jgi:hypothetical protein
VTTYDTIANIKGPQGIQGPIGLPGVNATPADAAVGGYLASYASATSLALFTSLGYMVSKPPNGSDDTTDLQASIASAITFGADLFVQHGTYLVSNMLVISGATGFRLHMAGRIKRVDTSGNRVAILQLLNCTDFAASVIRTDGNVANNGYGGFLVDEAKHDVRITNCVGVRIGLLDSINPAGDSLYIEGGVGILTTDVQIDTVSSVSDAQTGRNAVAVIQGKRLQFGKILSVNTGHPGRVSPAQIPMPGGLDIEPNLSTDVVEDVTVDSLIVKTAGSGGLHIMSLYGQIIKRVTVGTVVSEKLTGALAASTAGIIRGCVGVKVGSIRHAGEGVASGFSVMDSDDVQLDLRLSSTAGTGLAVGATGAVTNFKITGLIRTIGGHGVVMYAADNGELDMAIKDVGAGFACLSKNAVGTSSKVRFRGGWSKATTGSHWVNMAAAATDWILDGVRGEGWVSAARLQGTYANTARTLNCPGINFLAAAPTADGWTAGTIVWNSAPAAGGAPGWVCVTAGTPGTWKAMANVAA